MDNIFSPAAEELADFAHHREAYGSQHWMADRIKVFLERNVVLPKVETDSNEIIDDGGPISTGSGPEWAAADQGDNPNWIRNRAMNLLNLADYIENREAIIAAKKAAAEEALYKRRDELAAELAPRLSGDPNWYMNVSVGLRNAINRIIEMEEAAK